MLLRGKQTKHNMSNMPIRVLIADDYPLVRQGLVNILLRENDIAVVGEAADLDQCLHLCRTACPDVVLLDTALGDGSVITGIRLIVSQFPAVRIIAVADQSERNCAILRQSGDGRCRSLAGADTRWGGDCVVRAVRAGARGAIRLSDTTTELVGAVRNVHAGKFWVDGNATARLMESLFQSGETHPDAPIPNAALTTREDLICRLIAEGLSNKEIARRLFIAHQTVKNHVSAILRKSGLEDRLQIARAVLLNTSCPGPAEESSKEGKGLKIA